MSARAARPETLDPEDWGTLAPIAHAAAGRHRPHGSPARPPRPAPHAPGGAEALHHADFAH